VEGRDELLSNNKGEELFFLLEAGVCVVGTSP
jgi:hypothetical protein